MIDFEKLIKASVHFGHQKTRWCPKMAPYIWGVKNNIHLIDISKTANQLDKASRFLDEVSKEGKQILWIGTKKAAQGVIADAAAKTNEPYVNHRWVGGTLTNFSQVKKSITKLLHFEDIIEKAEKYPHYTKKELSLFQKQADRLKKNIGGIRNLKWPIGAIVLVDIKKEGSALKEAAYAGIPVVALVDTNCDPSLVDFVIPANDDAPKSIKLLIEYLADNVEKGKREAKAAKMEEQVEIVEEETVILEEDDEAIEDKEAFKKEKKVLVQKQAKSKIKKDIEIKTEKKIKPNVKASNEK
jgi:small subunit ribosomal protein S2